MQHVAGADHSAIIRQTTRSCREKIKLVWGAGAGELVWCEDEVGDHSHGGGGGGVVVVAAAVATVAVAAVASVADEEESSSRSVDIGTTV